MSSATCECYFVRHGETDWNLQDRIQGHTDIPLNSTGIAQAKRLRQHLADVPFSAAFSSDLSRAQQTAALILTPRSISITASLALRERSAGALEGLHKDEFDEKIRPFMLSEQAKNHTSYLETPWHPELETMHSVYKRVTQLLFHLAPHHLGESLLFVSHGGVLRSILDHLSFIPKTRWMVENCGFIKLQIEQCELKLSDSHLVSSKLIL